VTDRALRAPVHIQVTVLAAVAVVEVQPAVPALIRHAPHLVAVRHLAVAVAVVVVVADHRLVAVVAVVVVAVAAVDARWLLLT